MQKDFENYKNRLRTSKEFPAEDYIQSCLIWFKGNYGLFLLKNKNGEYYVAKVVAGIEQGEFITGLYIKDKIRNFPNLLTPEITYLGENPNEYSLFVNTFQINDLCKPGDIKKIFISNKYLYYITKSCSFNLAKYFALGNRLSYYQFIGFTLQVMLALQTLYKIGIAHGDLKPYNILVCDTHTSETVYELGNNKWLINSDQMEYKEIKLADFGDSLFITINNSCTERMDEIKHHLKNFIIEYMRKNTKNANEHEDYNQFIKNLENCQTNLYEVIMNSKIFSIFIVKDIPKNSNVVKLIE